MKQVEELYTKEDVFNSLKAYIKVLENDQKYADEELAKQILRNVIYSLNQIIDNLDE